MGHEINSPIPGSEDNHNPRSRWQSKGLWQRQPQLKSAGTYVFHIVRKYRYDNLIAQHHFFFYLPSIYTSSLTNLSFKDNRLGLSVQPFLTISKNQKGAAFACLVGWFQRFDFFGKRRSCQLILII